MDSFTVGETSFILSQQLIYTIKKKLTVNSPTISGYCDLRHSALLRVTSSGYAQSTWPVGISPDYMACVDIPSLPGLCVISIEWNPSIKCFYAVLGWVTWYTQNRLYFHKNRGYVGIVSAFWALPFHNQIRLENSLVFSDVLLTTSSCCF